MSNNRQLTFKQQAFVDAYLGDIQAAADQSDLSYDYARKLVTKPHIRRALREREQNEVRPVAIATRVQRQHFWSETMRDGECPMRERLRASELLAKSEGDFIQRIEQLAGPVKRLEELSASELAYMLGREPTETKGSSTLEDCVSPPRPGRS